MIDKPIPELEIEDLDRLFKEGEECDKRLFSEMRTNLQLISGQHYVKENSKYWQRIRDDLRLTNDQRLKLTKNHIQKVTKTYRNQIESYAPGVAFSPAKENELADQKAAQLNESVWKYICDREEMPARVAGWIQNFVEIGEVHTKIFWDLDGGQVVGMEAEMEQHPETGEMQPVIDPQTQQPVQSSKPVYGGRLKYEDIEGYLVKRDKDSRSFAESPYIILSKMRPRSALATWIKDEDERKKFETSSLEEYSVFDNNSASYRSTTDQVLVKEVFFRPAPLIPKGYFFIYSGSHKIAEGELPQGIFPVVSEFFDTQTGNARGISIVRPCRPPQIEINRCASKIAEHQITVGDDKVWVQANTKVQQGSMLPGVRVNTYSGATPVVQQGRSGEQYFAYMDAQIQELYQLANLEEVLQERQDSSDVYTNLFRSFRFRQKFAIYGQKFERFLLRVVNTSLELSRHHMSDEELVPAIGRNEHINIAEFKNTTPLSFQVHLQPRSDDIESQFGKQLTLNHVIQYTGQTLGKEDLGQMLRLSPFLNKEQMFKRFTQKYDRIVNDVLAMDRGQFRPPRPYDDHDYIIQALTTRMSEPDYENLPGVIQMLYQRKLQMHEQAKAIQMQELQRAESGFIPSGGYMVACDLYVTKDPSDPQKTQRVRVPSEALNWLLEKLKSQGSVLDPVTQMPGGVMQDMSRMMAAPAPGGAPQGLPQGSPPPPQQQQPPPQMIPGGIPNA